MAPDAMDEQGNFPARPNCSRRHNLNKAGLLMIRAFRGWRGCWPVGFACLCLSTAACVRRVPDTNSVAPHNGTPREALLRSVSDSARLPIRVDPNLPPELDAGQSEVIATATDRGQARTERAWDIGRVA